MRPDIVHASRVDQLVIEAGRLIGLCGGGEIRDGVLVAERGRITYVGDRSRQPEIEDGAVLIDASRDTVLPGLIDAHVHIQGNDTWDEARQFVSEVPRLNVLRSAQDAAAALYAGFTTVRDMGVPGPIEAVKRAIAHGVVDGPRIVNSVAAIGQTGGHADVSMFPEEWACEISPFVERGGPKGMMVDGPDACRVAIRSVIRQGADVIKLFLTHSLFTDAPETEHPLEFSDEELNILVTEAHRRGKIVAAHAESVESTRRAAVFGVDTIEHGMRIPVVDILEEMARRKTILVPTLSCARLVGDDGERWGFAPEECRISAEQVTERQEVVRVARRLGVPIAAGTSFGMIGRGKNLMELRLLMETGMTEWEAIVSATEVAARACGLGDRLGVICPNMLADLLVVQDDPRNCFETLESPKAIISTATLEAAS